MRYRLFFRKGDKIAVVKCRAHMRNKYAAAMIAKGYTLCAVRGRR